MTTNFAGKLDDFHRGVDGLSAKVPKALETFFSLAETAGEEGALNKKSKELIALCIGVARQCDGCIAYHVKALVELGVTEQELAEALAVAVYMGGGPSLMYSSEAWNAYREFSAA